MESERRTPRREKEPPQWHHIGGEAAHVDIASHSTDGMTESLQHQLQAMHSTFLTASDSILAQISEAESQLEQLERRIDEMVKEAGVNPSASKRSHDANGSSQQL